jgi:transcriptional regulator with XRE-family HTH domain
MGQRETSVVRQRRLRAELRRFREASGRTQKAVAEALGWSISKVIRIETGEVSISTSDVMALLHYYGVNDSRLENYFIETTRNRACEKSWWSEYRSFLSQRFQNHLGYEASSTRVMQYMSLTMPGLLQTEEYARVLHADHQHDAEHIERWTQIRMRRQELLNESECPEFEFVLDEAVLHRWVGGPGVMLRQLERLQELMLRPTISIRIVPFSAGTYPGIHGPSFTIFEFSSGDFAATLEDPDGDKFANGLKTPQSYYQTFLAVRQHACLEEEVTTIIEPVINKMRLGAMA